MKKIIFLLIISLGLVSCARVGSPDGGKKILWRLNFYFLILILQELMFPEIKELRLYFDEYVMLKDVSKNLIFRQILNIKKLSLLILRINMF
jgi:hypothetical protein